MHDGDDGVYAGGVASLWIGFLGPLVVKRDDEPVTLAQSQKTRALLAYLAVTGREHQRESLCRMFWDVTEDPRGALRWSLSKLRVLDDDAERRIRTDRQAHTVSFDPAGAFVDALEVRAATGGELGELSLDRLVELAGLFRGDFLDGIELADFDEFQAWRFAQREDFRSRQQRLLGHLVERLGDRPEEAIHWARELVRVAPEDASNRADLVSLLARAGLREEAEAQYELGRKRADRDGVSSVELEQARRRIETPSQEASAQAAPFETSAADQQVRFCSAPDGARIAFATLGHGPPLVKTANWLTHLEYDWKSPMWRQLALELSRERQLIRYDQRGSGLSDWDVDDMSLDAWVGDLKVVVDTLGLDSFPLLGMSQGCRVAVAFAARYPERVSHLVLYGGGARGWKHRDPGARATRAGLQAIIEEGWGRDIPAFRQVFSTLFMPEASAEDLSAFNELQRVSASAANARRITEAASDVDVSDLLARITAPTLVLHANRDAMVPFEEGRLLAAGIRDARFVALDSQNHLLLAAEPAFERFLSEIRRFIGS